MVGTSTRFRVLAAKDAFDFEERFNKYLKENKDVINLVQFGISRDGWFHAFILYTVMEPIDTPTKVVDGKLQA